MIAVGRRVQAWLQSSLRHWLAVPFIVATAILSLVGAAFGAYLIEQSFTRALTDAVAVAGVMAAHSVADQAGELRAASLEVAQMPAVQMALAGGDRAVTGRDLMVPGGPVGIDSLILLDPAGRVVNSFGGQAVDDGRPGWMASKAVSTSIRSMLEGGQSSIPPRLGPVSTVDGAGYVYALVPVFSSEHRLAGLVGAGLPLARAIEVAGESLSGAIVVYDLQGQPVFSTSTSSTLLPRALPGLPKIPAPADDRTLTFSGEVSGEAYVYGVHPILVDGQRVGFASVWRSLGDTRAYVRRWQLLFVLLIAVGAGSVLALTSRLVRQAVMPVTAMVASAQAVADGDYARSLPAEAIGELAVLASALNHMAERVHRKTDELREQVQHSNYLFEASAELGRTLDFDESLQTAVEAIYGLGQISYVVALTGRGELGPYTCKAVRGFAPEAAAQALGHEYPVPLWGVMARALVSRLPVVIDDVVTQNRPREGEFNWEVSSGSMLLFPVCGASRVFALLIAGAAETSAFSTGKLGELVSALARISSHSIQNAHLYQEAIRSQEQLVTLQMISRLVASSSQIDQVLDVVLREAAEGMGDSHVWLYLREAGSEAGRTRYTRPASAEDWGPVHQDAVNWVMQEGQPIFYNPDYPLVRSPILLHSGPAMCVPLEADEEVLGTLVVVSRQLQRVFIEDDMIVIRTLANAAAAALRTRQSAQYMQDGYLPLARAWAVQSDRRIWGRQGHTERVAANVQALAHALDLPVYLMPVLQVASYLHDIAGTTVDEDLLICRTGEETPHAVVSADWLAQAGLDNRVVTLVRYHHMARPDLFLADTELGRAAGIVVLAHAVDAWLMGARNDPHRSIVDVRALITADAGGKFIPASIDKFVELMDAKQLIIP